MKANEIARCKLKQNDYNNYVRELWLLCYSQKPFNCDIFYAAFRNLSNEMVAIMQLGSKIFYRAILSQRLPTQKSQRHVTSLLNR